MFSELRQLSQLFDGVFPRPVAFENVGCCVGPEYERVLLQTPRGHLSELNIAHPFNHYLNCFGTFEQMAYYVPRLLEVWAESENGFEYVMGFWGKLRYDRERYTALGLWDSVVAAVRGGFRARMETFAVVHYDREACRARGWGSAYFDHVPAASPLDDLLSDFFYPEFAGQPMVWEALFQDWGGDPNPHRTAYLLDLLKRLAWDDGPSTEDLYTPLPLPKGFQRQLAEPAFRVDLIARAAPVFQSLSSPTWEEDMRLALEMWG